MQNFPKFVVNFKNHNETNTAIYKAVSVLFLVFGVHADDKSDRRMCRKRKSLEFYILIN